MATYNITLNSTNVIGINNNTFQYNFVTGSIDIPDGATMSLSQVTIPYSFRNITASLGNNQWGYTLPDNTATTPLTLTFGPYTIPDGFYTTSDINDIIHEQMITNGHYWQRLTATEGTHNYEYEFPLSIVVNPSLYTNQIQAKVIPLSANIATVFGTNATKATGWTSYPIVAGYTGQFIFYGTTTPTSTLLQNILGFTSTNSTTYYPTSNVSGYSGSKFVLVNGNSLNASPPFPPLASMVNGVIVRCNLVSNPIASPSDILDSFAITSQYGSNINYLPIANNQVKMKKGRYNNLIISFSDQNYNQILALDPNVLITVIIRIP
jgi:hypothetical protein